MKRKTKLVLGGCAVSLGVLAVASTVILWYVVPAILLRPRFYTPAQMWSITHEWTRTAPLPAEATDVAIASTGSDFTRQFKAHFHLPSESLARWMASSPGFSDARITIEGDGTKVYFIKPGGGAMFSEIKLHPDGTVEINTYWS